MSEGTPEGRIYAALELRSGIETRYREYLEVWDHVSQGAKNGWRLSELWKETERAFRLGDRVVQVTFASPKGIDAQTIIYHTPVTNALRKRGERLGEFIHSARSGSHRNSEWWAKLHGELTWCEEHLARANTGILLGPPLKRGMQIQVNVEIPPGYNADDIKKIISKEGAELMADFQYLPELPEPLPEAAIVWNMEA